MNTEPQAQLELPGVGPAASNATPMVVAATATITALSELGRLQPHHAVLTQLVLSLAAAIDSGQRSGRASAVAMASRELRETLLQLDPPPEDGAAADAARELLEKFNAKLDQAVAATGGELRLVPEASDG